MSEHPITLSKDQERDIQQWAEDRRIWATVETTAFNLTTFARLMLKPFAARLAAVEKERDEAIRKQTALNGCRNRMANAFNAQDAEAFWKADSDANGCVQEWTPDLAVALAQRDQLRAENAELKQQLEASHQDDARFEKFVGDWEHVRAERDALRARCEKLETAFIQFVNDMHERKTHIRYSKALGCCVNCGFTVYGDHGRLFHYAYPDSKSCDQAALASGAGTDKPPVTIVSSGLEFLHNPAHEIGTCGKCGQEMTYNVPRLGPNGGYIHKATGKFECDTGAGADKL